MITTTENFNHEVEWEKVWKDTYYSFYSHEWLFPNMETVKIALKILNDCGYSQVCEKTGLGDYDYDDKKENIISVINLQILQPHLKAKENKINPEETLDFNSHTGMKILKKTFEKTAEIVNKAASLIKEEFPNLASLDNDVSSSVHYILPEDLSKETIEMIVEKKALKKHAVYQGPHVPLQIHLGQEEFKSLVTRIIPLYFQNKRRSVLLDAGEAIAEQDFEKKVILQFRNSELTHQAINWLARHFSSNSSEEEKDLLKIKIREKKLKISRALQLSVKEVEEGIFELETTHPDVVKLYTKQMTFCKLKELTREDDISHDLLHLVVDYL